MSLDVKRLRQQAENPFATFLAARHAAGSKSTTTWPSQCKEPHTTGGLAFVPSPTPAGDNFSTFLAPKWALLRTEEMLREDVLRAKRTLLEVTLETNSRALHPVANQEDAAQSPSAALSPILSAYPYSPLSLSSSVPNLQASASPFLPAISSRSPVESLRDEPMLSGWWSKTRCWNISISKRDMKARRQTLGLPGGTVVLGNGRMPIFNESGLAKGYFFAFQIDAVDDENFPLDGLKDMALVIGVSNFPARHRSCERPMYAYEVPDAVLVGYGGHLVDKGKWMKTSWDPKRLKRDDVVGVLVTEEGDIVVFVNEELVLRVKTSLNENIIAAQALSISTMSLGVDGESPSRRPSKRRASKTAPVKRVLFPILDLHGRVSAVTLLPRMSPPHVPLE